MADHVLVPRQKAVAPHFKFLFFQLHHERCAQVDQVGVSHIGKKSVGKALGVLFEQGVKIGFPEKIDELRKRFFCLLPVVPELKMIPVKKFDVLHGLKGRKFMGTLIIWNV